MRCTANKRDLESPKNLIRPHPHDCALPNVGYDGDRVFADGPQAQNSLGTVGELLRGAALGRPASPPPTNSRCCALQSAVKNGIIVLSATARLVRDGVIIRPSSDKTRSGSAVLGSTLRSCLEAWASGRQGFTKGAAGDELSITFHFMLASRQKCWCA
jgi:hypothetical protein